MANEQEMIWNRRWNAALTLVLLWGSIQINSPRFCAAQEYRTQEVSANVSGGETQRETHIGREAAGGKTIGLDELPDPPDWISKLIQDADISLTFGGDPVTDPSRALRGSKRLGAETRFKLKFDYRAQTDWSIRNIRGQRQVVIRIRYRRANLIASHNIWFLKRPQTQGFWANPLVLHELDHVRISSDPRIEKLFLKRLKENSSVTRALSELSTAGGKVNESAVRQVVDDVAQKVFDETIELVQIRYQELDRLTDHGLEPVPTDSEVAQWLKTP